MQQLTLRGFDEALRLRLEELARKHSISLNKAALLLMRRGAGLAATGLSLDPTVGSVPPIGGGLDRFIGVWSAAEERDFLESIASSRQLDPELWS